MKLHHYNEAYAWMVRREKFANGTPEPKPERTFADKLRTLKEVSKGISPESRLRLLDYFIQEALEKNQITKDQASGIYDQLQQDKDKIRDQIDAYDRVNFSEGSKDEQRKIADDEYYASLQKIIERDPAAKKFFNPDDITYPAMDRSGEYNYRGVQVKTSDLDRFKRYAKKRGLDQILSPESTFERKIEKGQFPVGLFTEPVQTGSEPGDLDKISTMLHEARHRVLMNPEFSKIIDQYGLDEEIFVRYLDKEFFPELEQELTPPTYRNISKEDQKYFDKAYGMAVKDYKKKFKRDELKEKFVAKVKSLFADGGRAGFSEGTKKYDYSNPLQKNQFIMRPDEEVQAIINDPKYKDYTRKDFINEGVLTRKETERKTLEFKNFGKKKKKPANIENIKRDEKIKKTQGSSISVKGSGQTGKQFSHVYPLIESAKPGTQTTFVIDAKMNRALVGYNRIGQAIAEEQEKLILEKPDGYKKKIVELNAKAKKNVLNAVNDLGKEFKGQIGYFQVDPDTGEFKPKAGNYKMSFAGIEGENKIYKDMTGKQRKDFERKISAIEKAKTIPGVTTADKILSGTGKVLKGVGKVIKPVGYAFGANAVKSAITKAAEQDIELNLLDKAMAFESGDPETAIDNWKRRNVPGYSEQQNAITLAKLDDDFEEIGKSTFGKYNDQIKNIKLP